MQGEAYRCAYPSVHVDSAPCRAVGQAGGVLLTRTVAATGLDRHLSAALARWRKPLAIHDPGKIITDLAISLALGGDCLADLALLRTEPALYGPVASDPTVSRAIATLASDAPAALKAINTARARAAAWALAGDHAPDHATDTKHPLIIDLDATLVTAHSEKENAAPTFKRGYGFHPLCAFLDHGAQGTGEPLSIALRPGNAGSTTAAPILARVIDYTIDDGRGGGEPIAYRLFTTLLDPEQAPASELALTYAGRWEIENAFDELKTHQRGPRTVLRSKSPDLVLQEIWGHLCCHYAIRSLMADAARQGGHDPDRVSFVAALRITRSSIAQQGAFGTAARIGDT